MDGTQQGTYSTASGDGLVGSTAGEMAEFEVVVRDLYGNLRSSDDELTVTLTPMNASFNRLVDDVSNGTLPLVYGTVEKISVGAYRVTYNTTLRGVHTLDVSLSVHGGTAEPISGSPWYPYTKVRGFRSVLKQCQRLNWRTDFAPFYRSNACRLP